MEGEEDTTEWIQCQYCDGHGYYGHHCGDGECTCPWPTANMKCEYCDGVGNWPLFI